MLIWERSLRQDSDTENMIWFSLSMKIEAWYYLSFIMILMKSTNSLINSLLLDKSQLMWNLLSPRCVKIFSCNESSISKRRSESLRNTMFLLKSFWNKNKETALEVKSTNLQRNHLLQRRSTWRLAPLQRNSECRHNLSLNKLILYNSDILSFRFKNSSRPRSTTWVTNKCLHQLMFCLWVSRKAWVKRLLHVQVVE